MSVGLKAASGGLPVKEFQLLLRVTVRVTLDVADVVRVAIGVVEIVEARVDVGVNDALMLMVAVTEGVANMVYIPLGLGVGLGTGTPRLK